MEITQVLIQNSEVDPGTILFKPGATPDTAVAWVHADDFNVEPEINAISAIFQNGNGDNATMLLLGLTAGRTCVQKLGDHFSPQSGKNPRTPTPHIDWWNHLEEADSSYWENIRYTDLHHLYDLQQGNLLKQVFGKPEILQKIPDAILSSEIKNLSGREQVRLFLSIEPSRRQLFVEEKHCNMGGNTFLWTQFLQTDIQWLAMNANQKRTFLEGPTNTPETFERVLNQIFALPTKKERAAELDLLLIISSSPNLTTRKVFNLFGRDAILELQTKKDHRITVTELSLLENWDPDDWSKIKGTSLHDIGTPEDRRIYAEKTGQAGWNKLKPEMRSFLFLHQELPEQWQTKETAFQIIKFACAEKHGETDSHKGLYAELQYSSFSNTKPKHTNRWWVIREILKETPPKPRVGARYYKELLRDLHRVAVEGI
jgi:hypothetical protein